MHSDDLTKSLISGADPRKKAEQMPYYVRDACKGKSEPAGTDYALRDVLVGWNPYGLHDSKVKKGIRVRMHAWKA